IVYSHSHFASARCELKTQSVLGDKRPEAFQILQISPRIVVWRFQDESAVREFGMLREPTQRISADVPFADVPVPIDAWVVRRFRIIEVNGADTLQPNSPFDDRYERFETIFFANVITRGERMRGVDTDAKRQLRRCFYDRA